VGDYLSYGTLTTPAATDRLLVCTPASSEVMQDTRAHFLPTVELGTTTLTGVGTLVLESGTLTGSSGGTAGLGTATYTPPSGGGGGSFAGGPVFGTTTTFSPPGPSNFSAGTIANSTIGTATLEQVTGGPLQVILPLQGNANGLACQWQTSNSNSATVIALAEATPLFLANNPQAFAAAIVAVGTNAIYAVGFSGSSGVAEVQLRLYSSNGQTLTAIPTAIPVASKTGWFKAVLLDGGEELNFYYSPNNVNNNWVGLGNTSFSVFGTITGMGVGCDGYQYYATWGGGSEDVNIEVDLWEWLYSSP